MKIYYLFNTILLSLILSNQIQGQQDHKQFTGHLRTGGIINKTDMRQSSFQGNKPDVFISGGLSYHIKPMNADLVGDLLFGTIDGNDDKAFFNTVFYDMSLNVRFDIMKWIMDSNFEVRPFFGVGMLFYAAKVYDIETRNLIQESPPYELKSLSPNPSANLGVEVTYPIFRDLAIAAGYNQKVVFGNDYFDAIARDKPFDNMGLIHAGFIFEFGDQLSRRKKMKIVGRDVGDIVELTHEEYAELVYRIDSLQTKLAYADLNSMEQLKIKVDEQIAEIDSLNTIIDSLKAGVFTMFTNDSSQIADIGDARYHVVLTSAPSRAEAQAYVDRTVQLDQSQMYIMKLPGEERYIIFYKSFKNIMRARKEMSAVKPHAPRAWVARI